ncbi:FMN-binding protein [Micromonospora narathiwatensis]|uniref:FMN-binding domain-containing protein n=1 Tax=Micromonospora narathiwatensis TaxID=299146 RepID=A0A1A8ZXQ2_9ACTN|nr:FMN-binding protein [Micromonospora narathiwatensis]SBT48924.1 FMN-binding domain-containing protein [Micromonospora narathiwatensis]
MRRALLAITGLAAGTTALVVLKGSPGATQVAQDRPVAEAPIAPDGPSAPTLTPGATDPAGGSVAPSASTTARPSPRAGASRTPGTAARPTTAAPKATTSAPRPATRTVTGPVVGYKYGSLQVRITLSGSRIVDATALGLPQGGQSGLRSDDVQARYSGTSGQVVAKQSANLDTVSGATYTSDAYRQSLQAAIDRA